MAKEMEKKGRFFSLLTMPTVLQFTSFLYLISIVHFLNKSTYSIIIVLLPYVFETTIVFNLSKVHVDLTAIFERHRE